MLNDSESHHPMHRSPASEASRNFDYAGSNDISQMQNMDEISLD